MQRSRLYATLVLALGLLLSSCSWSVSDEVKVTAVNLAKSELTLALGGETERLLASVLPEAATNKTLSWSSSDPSVATVSQAGEVAAVAVGSARIQVSTEDGGKTASCAVTVSAFEFATGYRQILHDYADYARYGSGSRPENEVSLPASVDLLTLNPYFGPVRDQGRQGSCLAFASAYVMTYTQNRMAKRANPSSASQLYSPAFIYNQVSPSLDSGMDFPEAMRILGDSGDCTEELMPYRANDYSTQPSQAARQQALDARIEGYTILDNSEYSLKAALASGSPVIAGIKCPTSFRRVRGADAHYTEADITENLSAVDKLHAVTLVGYGPKGFRILNSWGTELWGDRGLATISAGALQRLLLDAYLIVNDVAESQNGTIDWEENFGTDSRSAWVTSTNESGYFGQENWKVVGGALRQESSRTTYLMNPQTNTWASGYTSLKSKYPATTKALGFASLVTVSGEARIGARDAWFQRAGVASFGFNFSSLGKNGKEHHGTFWLQAAYSSTSEQNDAAKVMGIVFDDVDISSYTQSPIFKGYSVLLSQAEVDAMQAGAKVYFKFEIAPLPKTVTGYIKFGDQGSFVALPTFTDQRIGDFSGGNLLVQPILGTSGTVCDFDNIRVESTK